MASQPGQNENANELTVNDGHLTNVMRQADSSDASRLDCGHETPAPADSASSALSHHGDTPTGSSSVGIALTGQAASAHCRWTEVVLAGSSESMSTTHDMPDPGAELACLPGADQSVTRNVQNDTALVESDANGSSASSLAERVVPSSEDVLNDEETVFPLSEHSRVEIDVAEILLSMHRGPQYQLDYVPAIRYFSSLPTDFAPLRTVVADDILASDELSNCEKEVCAAWTIEPQKYLVLRRRLFRKFHERCIADQESGIDHATTKRLWTASKAQAVRGIDANKISKIHAWYKELGLWDRPPSSW